MIKSNFRPRFEITGILLQLQSGSNSYMLLRYLSLLARIYIKSSYFLSPDSEKDGSRFSDKVTQPISLFYTWIKRDWC
jgi:hypothetical protein